MALPKQRLMVRPESGTNVSKLAARLLREANVIDQLPTPFNRLFEFAEVTNVADLPDQGFLSTLGTKAREYYLSAKQKITGIADLRQRVSYVSKGLPRPRERFVQGHELGHLVLPWHNIDPFYLDNRETLSPRAKSIFEQEANFFSADLIFQGERFRFRTRDYAPSFDAIFELADQHGASRQCTAWRFVEEQDEAIALLQYYPGPALDDDGMRVLHLWRSIPSPAYASRYTDVEVPDALRTGHDWVAARAVHKPCNGIIALDQSGKRVSFEWHAWWNSRALLVLVRRRPMLRVIGQIVSSVRV